MKALPVLLLLTIMSGCATRTKQTDQLVKDARNLPNEGRILNVPHIEQEEFHCGPATMAMVLNYTGKKVSAEQLAQTMMVRNLPGTFQADMLLAARQEGMLTLEIKSLEHLLREVSQGHPVIVFQNLGLSSLPQWHYAVATGYDIKGPDIFLHTGGKKDEKIDMRFFERSWILGGRWALLVLPPDQLSQTASEEDHAKAVSYLEELKNFTSAKTGYLSMLQKWPHSLAAYIGLGNVSYQLGQKEQSRRYLLKASNFHPDSAIVWHNLATVQGELGRIKEARQSSKKAIQLSPQDIRKQFQLSLQNYL